MRHKLLFIYSVLLFSFQVLSAQYYQTGQDPASLKWKQIRTGRFNVIYPATYEREGIRYAKSLDEAYSKLLTIFPEKKFTIPVIIHSNSIQSNGYVAWAPRRMELYPTPEQNTIPLAPEQQLAIHELAHVMQMESLNNGFSKVLSFVFGEQFTGVISSLLPMWFLEGDAVFAESALTVSGRGRYPSFQKRLKALILENKKPYSYDKILNGSYRDFVPNDYETGFQMVTLALKNDPQIWNKVIKFTSEEPFTINPVNISLTRSSGLRKKTLWQATSDTLKTIWSKSVAASNTLDYDAVNPDKHGKYINYYSPVFVGADSIVAIKTSLSFPPSFVLINPSEKHEKRIFVPGALYPWFISCSRGKLVWVETQPDPRWENREYSVIKVLNIRTGVVKRISQKSRYLSAAISPAGDRIVAVENTISNINNIVFVNALTGIVEGSVHASGNVYLQHPQWSQDGKKITFIFLSEAGEGILSFKVDTQEWENLVNASRDDLQSCFLRNDSLFYISSSSGTDNVYLRTPDNKIKRVTRSKFGTIDVASSGDKMLFGNYSFLGNNICIAPISTNPQAGQESSDGSSFLINKFDIKAPPDRDTSMAGYTTEPYRKWQHLFRFHSWMPFYADLEAIQSDPASVRPGLTILSQNSLSTLTSTIGYEYSKEKRNVVHSKLTWSGLYPVIESQLDYGALPAISKMGQNVADPSSIQQGISFINTISIPLQFTTSRFSQFVRPSISADYLNQYIYLKETRSYDYGQTIITARFYFSNYDRSAIRDIYPKWAQVVDFNYCFAPFDHKVYGSASSLKTAFYFPGFLPNNGIKIRFEMENQNPEKYLYTNFTSLPRGYSNIYSKQILFLSADYVLPLVYPDLRIASLLYIKRFRTGFFYDYATGPGNSLYEYTSNGLTPLYDNPEFESLSSFGLQFLADFHLFRIPFMMSGGIQSAWKSINKSPVVEALFNIDLFGLTVGKRKM